MYLMFKLNIDFHNSQYVVYINVNRLGLGRAMLTDPYHCCMEADIG